MAPKITIEKAEGTYVIRGGDAILAETENALRLEEDGHPPVIYIPRADVAMMFLEPSETRTRCPWKGEATHYSLHAAGAVVADVGWSYEAPNDEVGAIAGHLAFYTDKVAVEHL